jgi:hypothetical protein
VVSDIELLRTSRSALFEGWTRLQEVMMWRKAITIAIVGILLLVGINLLRSISRDVSAPATRAPTHASGLASTSTPSIHSDSTPAQTIEPVAKDTEPVTDEAKALFKDPKSARKVLGFIGSNLGSPAAKVEAIRTAIVDSGACTDNVCSKTKESLLTRIEAASAQFHGQLTAKSVECYQVGCIVDVSAPSSTPLALVMDRMRQAGQLDWPVPSMYSRPTMSKGTQSSMWVLFNPSTQLVSKR